MKDAPYGKGAHVLRKADPRPHATVALKPAADCEPGFFLALVTQHNWPPQFVPRWCPDRSFAPQSKASRAMREAGVGHAGVDLGLPGAADHVKRWRKSAGAGVAA